MIKATMIRIRYNLCRRNHVTSSLTLIGDSLQTFPIRTESERRNEEIAVGQT